MQENITIQEISDLNLRPSSTKLNWKIVRGIIGISCSKSAWKPPNPPFHINLAPILSISGTHGPAWTRIVDAQSEFSYYSVVETILIDSVLTCESSAPALQGKYKVIHQFPVLDAKRQGSDYTVDFACGIVVSREFHV